MNTDILSKFPVIPVMVIDSAEDALPLTEAFLEGGLGVIEVTFRTEAAFESIRRIRARFPEMTVSAGTVLTLDQAQKAIDAGAQFCLAPGLDPEIVHFVTGQGIPFIPGVATPTEIQGALKLGCRHMKFFPAEASGGTAMLTAMAAPFKSNHVQFCPTGGLKLSNMADYLKLPEVFTIGGSWIATAADIRAGNWAQITENARAALAMAATVRPT